MQERAGVGLADAEHRGELARCSGRRGTSARSARAHAGRQRRQRLTHGRAPQRPVLVARRSRARPRRRPRGRPPASPCRRRRRSSSSAALRAIPNSQPRSSPRSAVERAPASVGALERDRGHVLGRRRDHAGASARTRRRRHGSSGTAPRTAPSSRLASVSRVCDIALTPVLRHGLAFVTNFSVAGDSPGHQYVVRFCVALAARCDRRAAARAGLGRRGGRRAARRRPWPWVPDIKHPRPRCSLDEPRPPPDRSTTPTGRHGSICASQQPSAFQMLPMPARIRWSSSASPIVQLRVGRRAAAPGTEPRRIRRRARPARATPASDRSAAALRSSARAPARRTGRPPARRHAAPARPGSARAASAHRPAAHPRRRSSADASAAAARCRRRIIRFLP